MIQWRRHFLCLHSPVAQSTFLSTFRGRAGKGTLKSQGLLIAWSDINPSSTPAQAWSGSLCPPGHFVCWRHCHYCHCHSFTAPNKMWHHLPSALKENSRVQWVWTDLSFSEACCHTRLQPCSSLLKQNKSSLSHPKWAHGFLYTRKRPWDIKTT